MANPPLNLSEMVVSRLDFDTHTEPRSALNEALLEEMHLDGNTLKRVAITLPRQIVARAIEVDSSELHKLYRRKRLSKLQSEKISDLTALWAQLNVVFAHDSQAMHEWLNAELPALRGRSPSQLMETLSGRKALRETLNRLQYGDFS